MERLTLVERRNPTQEELGAVNILVGDVGMVLNPSFNNFDHHQDAQLDCAFKLVLDLWVNPTIEKIIVHGGFVAHMDEILMVALIDATVNNQTILLNEDGEIESIDLTNIKKLAEKVSILDTKGPNVFKKVFEDEVISTDSFKNFLQEKWAKNPNDPEVRYLFMRYLLNTDGSFEGGFPSPEGTVFEDEYQKWYSKKEDEKKRREATLSTIEMSLKETNSGVKFLVVGNTQPLSSIDGLNDAFGIVDFCEKKFGVTPDITISIAKNRDGGEMISLFRTASGEEKGINLKNLNFGSNSIFAHANGFLHNIKVVEMEYVITKITETF